MSHAQRDAMTKLTLQLIVAGAAHAVNSGTFDSRLNRGWYARSCRSTSRVSPNSTTSTNGATSRRSRSRRALERQAEDPSRETISTETFAGFYERAPAATNDTRPPAA